MKSDRKMIVLLMLCIILIGAYGWLTYLSEVQEARLEDLRIEVQLLEQEKAELLQMVLKKTGHGEQQGQERGQTQGPVKGQAQGQTQGQEVAGEQ